MSEISQKTDALGSSCRHFNGREFLCGDGEGRSACAKGHPIRKIVIAANKGSGIGIAFKTPCRPGPERVADCPDYDAKTPEEIEASRAEMKAHMAAAVKMMGHAAKWKAKMIAAKKATGRASCPCCDGVETVQVSIALGYNNHMACQCSACGVGFRE